MPRLLVLYGTTDGHTARIARFLGDEFRALGASVDVIDAATGAPAPAEYAGIIVAASVHGGGHQRSVVRWAHAHALQLHLRPNAFLSVCLGVLQPAAEVERELQDIRDRFVKRSGWVPAEVKVVAGALPYSRYGWLRRQVMRWIVRRVGGPTDMSRDYEFTDWTDLRAFARRFYGLVVPPPVPVEPRRSEDHPAPRILTGVGSID
jgi:menaquinone-dependent protoporphyrinogen oxidase